MRVRSLDVNGDWTFGKGSNNYKRNNDAVAQLISTRLKSFLGDCFFATNDGIDWFNLLGSKNKVAIDLAVSAIILKTPDVLGLNQLSTNLDSNRNYTIQYTVTTTYSTISSQIVIGV